MLNRVPLFVTRHSLSSRSAIGVQTRQLAEANTDWMHFHWWTSEVGRQDERSILLENWLVSRYSIFKRGRYARLFSKAFPVSKWRGPHLRHDVARFLRQRFAERISCVYVAPLDRDDAVRCRSIVQALNRPFVLHVWDFLDGGPDCEEHRWLISNATQVFCLSQPALDAVSLFCPTARELLFYRPPSRSRARAPSSGRLVINLVGDVGSYSTGLNFLDEAIDLLRDEGIEPKVQYVGTLKASRLNSRLARRLEVLGFIADKDDFDAALCTGNVAFLSGPFEAPSGNFRSQFSIPSRILDYLAVGTPIVGTVHPESATGKFLARHRVESSAFASTARTLTDALRALSVPEYWQIEQQKCVAAFAAVTRAPPPIMLREAMSAIGTAP